MTLTNLLVFTVVINVATELEIEELRCARARMFQVGAVSNFDHQSLPRLDRNRNPFTASSTASTQVLFCPSPSWLGQRFWHFHDK